MRTLLLLSAVVLVSLILWLEASAAPDADKSTVANSPLVVFTSNDSHMSKADYRKIASAEEWTQTWLEHLGMQEDTIYRPSMEVDFSRCTVVAIFSGKSINGRGFRVESVTEDNDKIVVRFDDISYQTAGPDGGGDQVTPYAFIVLPKSEKPVVLEENVQNIKGELPKWKEVARLK